MTPRLHLTANESRLAVRWLADAADANSAIDPDDDDLVGPMADALHDRWLAAKSRRVAIDLDEAQQVWIALDLHRDTLADDTTALLNKVTPFAFPDLTVMAA